MAQVFGDTSKCKSFQCLVLPREYRLVMYTAYVVI